jgi:hypothetical protein
MDKADGMSGFVTGQSRGVGAPSLDSDILLIADVLRSETIVVAPGTTGVGAWHIALLVDDVRLATSTVCGRRVIVDSEICGRVLVRKYLLHVLLVVRLKCKAAAAGM